MSYPKMKACPRCGSDKHLAVFSYDSGWRHVECTNRFCGNVPYLGPGEGSILAAIRSHNKSVAVNPAPK